MKFFKNIVLMFAVNIGIVITLSIVLHLLGVGNYITAQGINLPSLAVFCLVWGMGGAFISLLLSKVMVKWMMGVKIIENPQSSSEPVVRKLYEMLRRSSERAGLDKIPELGIYDSPELNAFATGPSRRRSLVAVSTGLLHSMDDNEVEGVIGHEVAHIANGDMITMTLLQGVVNALIMFVARIIAFAVASRAERESSRQMLHFVTVIACELILGIFGVMITAWFSRKREFRADAASAKYVGREKMIAALQALQSRSRVYDEAHPSMQAFKISSAKKSGFLSLFMTHPPLEDRINALRTASLS
jgi:heat shock protein HtpX